MPVSSEAQIGCSISRGSVSAFSRQTTLVRYSARESEIMGDITEVPRPRINASMLAQYMGQPVCFVGRVDKVHPTGTSFVLCDGDGKKTTVELPEPLEEELSGVIEVVGKVTPKATIMGVSYVPFREDVASFDLSLYDETLKIMHEFPQYYPFGQKGME